LLRLFKLIKIFLGIEKTPELEIHDYNQNEIVNTHQISHETSEDAQATVRLNGVELEASNIKITIGDEDDERFNLTQEVDNDWWDEEDSSPSASFTASLTEGALPIEFLFGEPTADSPEFRAKYPGYAIMSEYLKGLYIDKCDEVLGATRRAILDVECSNDYCDDYRLESEHGTYEVLEELVQWNKACTADESKRCHILVNGKLDKYGEIKTFFEV